MHLRYSQQYSNNILAFATTEHIGLYMEYHLNQIIVSTEAIDSTIAHEIGHIIDVSPRIYKEQTNNVITQLSDYLDNKTDSDFKIAGKALIKDDIDIYLRGCRVQNTSECNGLFYNYYDYKLGYTYWWFIEFIHKEYWGELYNLYRYNISLIKKQYHFILNNEKECYSDKEKYNIQILNVTSFLYSKTTLRYNITLPIINCGGHLGFEIYENEELIDFSHDNYNYYIDENKYEDDYIPRYKIIAFDRLLEQSNPSDYKMAENYNDINQLKNIKSSFLKFR